jgi:hypothetical protein
MAAETPTSRSEWLRNVYTRQKARATPEQLEAIQLKVASAHRVGKYCSRVLRAVSTKLLLTQPGTITKQSG